MNIFERAFEGDVKSILFLGSLWVLLFVIKYHIELVRIKKWPSVVGQLDKFLYREGGVIVEGAIIIRYHFELQGKLYKGRRLAHMSFGPSFGLVPLKKHLLSKAQRLPDEKVIVYYNPRNPKKNLLVKPSVIEFSFLSACYAFFAFIVYLAYIN